MERPYIYCHLVTTLDGKATGEWMKDPKVKKAMMRVFTMHPEFKAESFGVGKNAAKEFTSKEPVDLTKYQGKNIPFEDYISPKIKDKYFCLTFDRKGSLWFKSPFLDIPVFPWYSGAHYVQILTEQVKPEYLAYLQDIGVSYLFGGKETICVKDVMKKLKEKFGATKFVLEGGPTMSEAFLKEGVIDELSLFICSITAEPGAVSTFNNGHLAHFKIAKCEVAAEDNYIHLTYKKDD